jgi:hypothetical protein
VIGVHWITLLRWVKNGAIEKPGSATIRNVKYWRWDSAQINRARAYQEAHGRWPDKKRQESWKREKEARPRREQAAKRARDKRRRSARARFEDEWRSGKFAEVFKAIGAPSLSAMHDSFVILGLNDDARLEEVKAQYRELAKLYHPDKRGNAEMMVKINGAYELLCKELKPQPE